MTSPQIMRIPSNGKMPIFGRARVRELEALVALLQSEISDLREQRRQDRAETQRLLDRVMALTEPGALRESRRGIAPPTEPAPAVAAGARTVRAFFPGRDSVPRPGNPLPPTPQRIALAQPDEDGASLEVDGADEDEG